MLLSVITCRKEVPQLSVQRRSIGYAILAAVLYSLSAPLSKQLLASVSATMMAALLYLGAGLGMCAVRLGQRALNTPRREQSLARADLPYVAGMVALDIAAPIFLMTGLSETTASNAALLNNFEIVATALIALLLFREPISRRLWLAIALVTLASALLSFEDASSLSFSRGSPLVLLACVCWGFENNCTRRISSRDPVEIVIVKGFGSGLGALCVALLLDERLPAALPLLGALLLGFVAYGLSILLYLYAQRGLGAARTSAYYALAPFFWCGAVLSSASGRLFPRLCAGAGADGCGCCAGAAAAKRSVPRLKSPFFPKPPLRGIL